MAMNPDSARPGEQDDVGGRGAFLTAGAAALVIAITALVALRGPEANGTSSPPGPAGDAAVPPAASPAPASTTDLDELPARAKTMETVEVPPRGDQPGFTYRVPRPGDPDHEDYKAMLSHPEIARFAHEKPLYYDPEWRAQVTGRREVEPHDLGLQDAAGSLEQLLEFVFLAVSGSDRQALDRLRVNRDEYQLILWPEFPQSRPFLRIPPDEAWSFQVAGMRNGAGRALQRLGGQPLEPVSHTVGGAREYTNFRILEGVIVQAENADTGERMDLDFVEAVVECRGRYKVLMYGE